MPKRKQINLTVNTTDNKPKRPRRQRQPPKRRVDRSFKASINAGGLAISTSASGLQTSQAPVAINKQIRTNQPSITRSTNGKSARIVNSELLSAGMTGPNGASYYDAVYVALNPGLAASFPWLSGIARQYQLYKFNQLIFEFIPCVGSQNTGDVVLVPTYIANYVPPNTEAQAMANHGAVEGTVWQNLTCEMNPVMMQAFSTRGGYKYIRPGIQSGDVRTTDAGFFICALASLPNPAIANYGKLLVHYDVSLEEPIYSQITDEIYPSQLLTLADNVGGQTLPFSNLTAITLNFNQLISDGLHTYFINTGPLPLNKWYLPAGVYHVEAIVNFVTNLSASGSAGMYDYLCSINTAGSINPTVGKSQLTISPSASSPFYAQVRVKTQIAFSDNEVNAGNNYFQIGMCMVAILANPNYVATLTSVLLDPFASLNRVYVTAA